MTAQTRFNTRTAPEVEVTAVVARTNDTGVSEPISIRFRRVLMREKIVVDMDVTEALELLKQLRYVLREELKR